jgi:hypothetical protein
MAVRWTRPRADNYPIIVTLRIELLDIRENATSVPPVPRKLWFIWTSLEANSAWLMIEASAGRKQSRNRSGSFPQQLSGRQVELEPKVDPRAGGERVVSARVRFGVPGEHPFRKKGLFSFQDWD